MGKLLRYFSNIPGWRTNRKIVVIESDDWGSTRMPSKETLKTLINSGVQVGRSRYNLYDSFESNQDLESLFEVLSSFKDMHGNQPAITALCVVANPDFDKIRECEFKNYYYEPFTSTLTQYPAHDKVMNLWKEGIERKIFIPQFHGREHLNVPRWLRDLQSNNRDTLLAFQNNIWGISTPLIPQGYQAAFDIDFDTDLEYHKVVIKEGLGLFKELLGYPAEYFVPSNGPFKLALEKILFHVGIKYITLNKKHKEPIGNGKFKTHYHYLGKRSSYELIYLSRNAAFEPSAEGTNWVDSCLSDVQIAFRMKKPAVISTHRVNYIGFLDSGNREKGLTKLKELLTKILKTWPDVEFMTSVELGKLIDRE